MIKAGRTVFLIDEVFQRFCLDEAERHTDASYEDVNIMLCVKVAEIDSINIYNNAYRVLFAYLGSMMGASKGSLLRNVMRPKLVGLCCVNNRERASILIANLRAIVPILIKSPSATCSKPWFLNPIGIAISSISGAPGPEDESSCREGRPGNSLGSSDRKKHADSAN